MKLLFPDGTTQEISVNGKTMEELLALNGMEPLEVLISRDGEIIPEDTIPSESDTVRIIIISHGG